MCDAPDAPPASEVACVQHACAPAPEAQAARPGHVTTCVHGEAGDSCIGCVLLLTAFSLSF